MLQSNNFLIFSQNKVQIFIVVQVSEDNFFAEPIIFNTSNIFLHFPNK